MLFKHLDRWLKVSRPMTRCALSVIVLIGLVQQSFAAPVLTKTLQLTNPGGVKFEAVRQGDEYAHWLETVDGYSIVDNDGVWYYAVLGDEGELVSSDVMVGMPLLDTTIRPEVHPVVQHQRPEHNPRSIVSSRGIRAVTSQKILAILVDFDNVAFTYSDASFQTLFFAQTDSVNEYFNDNSYGQFDIVPAEESFGTANDGVIHVNHPDDHPDFGSSFSNSRDLFKDVLDLADPYIDFSSFDVNEDDYVGVEELSIVVIVAGYETAFGGAPPNNIWAHKTGLVGVKTLDGVDLAYYAMAGEVHSDEGDEEGTYSGQATIGILCHELGHLMFDLPDLYDTDGSSSGIGYWSGMSNGAWGKVTNPGDTPVWLDAWSRVQVGFSSPIVLDTTVSTESMEAVTYVDDVRIIHADKFQSPLSQEYFYLENRQAVGFDADIPGEGLLVYHVDESQLTNSDESRRLVDVEAADGFNDMDDVANENTGDDGDPFPGASNSHVFAAATNPSSHTNDDVITDIELTQIDRVTNRIEFNFRPGGDSLFYDEQYGEGSFLHYNDLSDWSALEHTNTTEFDELHGIEIWLRDHSTIDAYWYESMVGNVPTNLLDSELGLSGGPLSWNRLMLAEPFSFPVGSTRVLVLNITNQQFDGPIRTMEDGNPAEKSWLSNDGVTYTHLTAAAGFPHDLRQHLLMSTFAPSMSFDVYVDPDHDGDELGTSDKPFTTITEALAYVINGGNLHIVPEIYVGQTAVLNREMSLVPDGPGTITLK